MSLLTERAIFQTFEEMLIEMPFDKITVTALTKRCRISTNTFYYHYQDLYELLNVWLSSMLEKAVNSDSEDSWKEKTKRILNWCKAHPQITYHIWNSLSREQVERAVFGSSDSAIFRKVQTYGVEYGVPDSRITEIAQFCQYAYAGFFLQFLYKKMNVDVDENVERLAVLFDTFVRSSIQLFEQEKK